MTSCTMCRNPGREDESSGSSRRSIFHIASAYSSA